MKTLGKSIAIFGLFLGMTINVTGCGDKTATRDINDQLLDSIVSFSVESGEKLLSRSDKNEIYSPLSLYNILNMMLVLTDENSDSYLEISEAIDATKESVNKYFKLLNSDITDGLMKSKVSNSLWYDNAANTYNEDYLNGLKKPLGMDVKKINFVTEGPSKISNYIDDKTRGLITPSPIDFEFLRTQNFALLNTLYYDGDWAQEFENRRHISFINENGNTTYYQAMHKKEEVSVYEDYRVESIKMNYKDGAYMILIKPADNYEQKETIDDILQDHDMVTRIIKHYRDIEGLAQRELDICIPKFTVDSSFMLKDHIKNDLYIDSIYKNGRDFSMMLNEGATFEMNDIIQMSHIEVDEKGTKAAAATISVGCAGMAYMGFVVDQPTAYIIMSETDIPMFMGIIRNVEGTNVE